MKSSYSRRCRLESRQRSTWWYFRGICFSTSCGTIRGGRLFARFRSKKRKGENPFPPLPPVIGWELNVKQQSTVSGRRALVVNSNVFDPMFSVLLGGGAVSIGRLRRIECQYGGFAGYPHPARCVCVLRWLLRDTRHKKMPDINDGWWHSDLSTK